MEWDQKSERRLGSSSFCSQHIETVKLLTKVSTSLENMLLQMADNNNFRRGITTSMIGISFAMCLQIGAVSYTYGQMSKQITVNTTRLDVIEQTAREFIKDMVVK
jgi:hypothetical protein